MNRRIGTGELVVLVALMTATGALAIDQMLPAFSEMRVHFDLDADSTRLSLAVYVVFVGCGVGNSLRVRWLMRWVVNLLLLEVWRYMGRLLLRLRYHLR